MSRVWEPPAEYYSNAILEQSPWKRSGSVPGVFVPPVELPFVRFLSGRLQSTDGFRRYELILGPRRVGKTTVMYQAGRRLLRDGVSPERIWWLRLDHSPLTGVPLGNLVKQVVSGRSAGDEAFLFIDELAYSHDWDKWLKTFYDEHWPVKIVATSSAASALTKKSESGVGRWSERFLRPCLLGEYMRLGGVPADIPASDNLRLTVESVVSGAVSNPPSGTREYRRKLLLVGGFPELLLKESGKRSESDLAFESQRVLREDAIERAIHKDITQSFGIDSPMLLEHFLYTLAGNMAGVLSPAKIGSGLRMSQATFDRYLSYLERAFLVFTLPNYSGSERAVQRRGRKLYFVDGAVRNAALLRGVSLLEDTGETGLLLENMVGAHLRTLGYHTRNHLYYWRDGKYEADFIYDHPDHPVAVEVASSRNHSRKGLIRLMERHPQFRGACYMVSPDAVKIHPNGSPDGVGSIPLDLFLLCVSAQAERALRESF